MTEQQSVSANRAARIRSCIGTGVPMIYIGSLLIGMAAIMSLIDFTIKVSDHEQFRMIELAWPFVTVSVGFCVLVVGTRFIDRTFNRAAAPTTIPASQNQQ